MPTDPEAQVSVGEQVEVAIWRRWFEYLQKRQFNPGGPLLSAADQMAFYEIAQPMIRDAEAAAREPLEQEITRLKGHRSESACVSGSHLYDWLRDESRLAPTRIDIINLFEDVERDAHARGVADAREEDCKALCVFCEGGIEVHPPPMQDTWRKLPCWWHKTGCAMGREKG